MKNMRNLKPEDLARIGLDPKLFHAERLLNWLIKPRNPILASDSLRAWYSRVFDELDNLGKSWLMVDVLAVAVSRNTISGAQLIYN